MAKKKLLFWNEYFSVTKWSIFFFNKNVPYIFLIKSVVIGDEMIERKGLLAGVSLATEVESIWRWGEKRKPPLLINALKEYGGFSVCENSFFHLIILTLLKITCHSLWKCSLSLPVSEWGSSGIRVIRVFVECFLECKARGAV